MNSEDNSFSYFNSSKSIFNNDLITQINSILIKKIERNNNLQQYSYYLRGNSSQNENEKSSIIKDESESENEKNIENFLTKDIINSINEIDSEPDDNSSKNESMKEISIQDETESYEEEKNSFQKNSEDEDEGDIINDNDLDIEKEIINRFPFDLNIDNPPEFLADNNFPQITDNSHLNNIININNEKDKINGLNFNTNPSKIFNIDNHNKLNGNYIKTNRNSEENNPINKNNEITNLNGIYSQNEAFKLNSENIKINNDKYLKNGEYFDNNYINQEYINFDNKINNKQNPNNYNENNFMNKNNKIKNNFKDQKDSYNKMNNNEINLNSELNDKEQKNILYMNNKIICYNNYINLINPIDKNKNINFDSHDMINNINDIPFGKGQDNLIHDDYLITMFGKMGWICRLCNNFNYITRSICNRCKVIKTPKTKEEINEEKEIEKIMKKKIKEKRVDWFCPNCNNINYGFRRNCNRCKIERKKEFPLVISKIDPKLNGNNNSSILANNINIYKN